MNERSRRLRVRSCGRVRHARDGSNRLSDVETPFLDVVCVPCGRGRYAVVRLMAKQATPG